MWFLVWLFLWLPGLFIGAHRLSCPMACGILVPRPGIEPSSLTLAGGFLTTGPPGKSPRRVSLEEPTLWELFTREVSGGAIHTRPHF